MIKTLIVAALLAFSAGANAAMLISCGAGVDGFGNAVWIGIYREYDGRTFRMMFPMNEYAYCPTMV